jgi:hypothetical protein
VRLIAIISEVVKFTTQQRPNSPNAQGHPSTLIAFSVRWGLAKKTEACDSESHCSVHQSGCQEVQPLAKFDALDEAFKWRTSAAFGIRCPAEIDAGST